MTLALVTSEPLAAPEKRKFVKVIVERIFAQQIYTAVIRALVNYGNAEGPGSFGLSKVEIDWLARTFYREKLGSQEHAYVCMWPAYDPRR